jgi:DNA replication protein DnaC
MTACSPIGRSEKRHDRRRCRAPAIDAGDTAPADHRPAWQSFAARADTEGWGAARYLAALCEHELAERAQRRIARHLRESGLPEGKTFATFDFAAVPTVRKAHLLALAEADSWIEQGANILCFGPSGTGKSHAAAAIGYALIEQGRRVLFTRTTDIVQRPQAARRDLSLPALLAKLDRLDCLVLDDLGYARKDQAETAVLFELIAERYERRSLIITCNQPFSAWEQIFPDPAMTVAAIDRLVHHATILEFNTESYRRRTALAAAEHTAG